MKQSLERGRCLKEEREEMAEMEGRKEEDQKSR